MGREAECARLDRLVQDVVSGDGDALLLRGPAGVGKSALLDVARERARSEGVTVLAVQGVESEVDLPFATLGDLLDPLLDAVPELPAPQARAVEGALALGPPVPGDRFAVCVATLALLSRRPGAAPVVVVVDDAQWVDAPSWEALAYVARRTAGRPLGVVASARPADLPGAGSLGQLRVSPLPPPVARDLLLGVAPDLVRGVADRVLDAAGGLPLALVEILAGLDPEQRRGVVPLDVPLRPGRRLTDVYRRRVDALPAPVRTALLVAAAYEGDDLRAIGAACAAAGGDARVLASAEEAGLLTLTPERLTFTHPLCRGAAYHGATPRERRAAHAALASVSPGATRVWHRAAATVGPDEEVAAGLAEWAAAHEARRAPGPASEAYERAARLTPGREAFARRLLTAGTSAATAGQAERALRLLEEAADAGDGPTRAAARHLQGITLLWARGVEPAVRVLVAEAAAVESTDPSRAATMLADASLAFAAAADTRAAVETAERAAALVGMEASPAVRARVLAALGWALLLRGRAERARRVLAAVDRLVCAVNPLGPTGDVVKGWLYAGMVAGTFETTGAAAAVLCSRAREAGALGALGGLLVVVADCAYRAGDWPASDAALAEAFDVGRDTGQPMVGHAAVLAARSAAARGEAGRCRALAGAVLSAATATGMGSGLEYAHAALGFLELGLSRTDAALEHLEEVARAAALDGMEEPTLIPWGPDLVEAYLRLGRTTDARSAARVLERRSRAAGTPVAEAAAARCRGLVEDRFDEHFERALGLDDERPMPFERARTQLAFGRRLHRAKRRAEARTVLHQAVRGFQRLGAAPWEGQATAELRAAGGRRHDSGSPPTLTEQERRVACAVVRGSSTREVAAELFLSPKTVEFHLSKVYRKLQVHSRTQLAAARGWNGPAE